MSAHTPGPWVLTQTGAFVYSESHPTDYFWMDVRLAHPKFADQDPSFLANGRLIAAAPEMLALLIRLKNAGDWYGSALEINRYGADAEDGEELEEAINALISKATQP